jgi:hypothetical protein
MRDPDLRMMMLGADGPVVNARYTISGELTDPFRNFEPGERVSAEIVGTYRYDTYGLLIEQWVQVDVQREGTSGEQCGPASHSTAEDQA